MRRFFWIESAHWRRQKYFGTQDQRELGFICSCLRKWNWNTNSICWSSMCMQRKLSCLLPLNFQYFLLFMWGFGIICQVSKQTCFWCWRNLIWPKANLIHIIWKQNWTCGMYDSGVLFWSIFLLLVVIIMWKFPLQYLLKLMSVQECAVSLG